jgi:ketosteroid isomerase-like protein
LSFGGELSGQPSEDFSDFVETVKNRPPTSRAALLDLIADDAEWIGPANALTDHAIRIVGREKIEAHLREFDKSYEIMSMTFEESAQAEDTLALRLSLELRSLQKGEVTQMPAFGAFTKRNGRIVRVVEVYDSLRLLPQMSTN